MSEPNQGSKVVKGSFGKQYDILKAVPEGEDESNYISDEGLKSILLGLLNKQMPRKLYFFYVLFPILSVVLIISGTIMFIQDQEKFKSEFLGLVLFMFIVAFILFICAYVRNRKRSSAMKKISSCINTHQYQELYEWFKTDSTYDSCLAALCYYKLGNKQEAEKLVGARYNSIYAEDDHISPAYDYRNYRQSNNNVGKEIFLDVLFEVFFGSTCHHHHHHHHHSYRHDDGLVDHAIRHIVRKARNDRRH